MNFYQTLQVSPEASEAIIRAAYKTLAQQYHPDKNLGNPSSEEKFKEINEAYKVLSDPLLRKAYDNKISEGSQKQPQDTSYHNNQQREATPYQKENAEPSFSADEFAAIEAARRGCWSTIYWGVFWFVLGVGVTGYGYYSAVERGGGRYLVTYGLVAYGLILILKGSYRRFKLANILRSVEYEKRSSGHNSNSTDSSARQVRSQRQIEKLIDLLVDFPIEFPNKRARKILIAGLIGAAVYVAFRPESIGLGDFDQCYDRLPPFDFENKTKREIWSRKFNECTHAYDVKLSSEEIKEFGVEVVSVRSDGLIARIVKKYPKKNTSFSVIYLRIQLGAFLRYIEIKQDDKLSLAGDFFIPFGEALPSAMLSSELRVDLVEARGAYRLQ
jgi:curved DNA-binding protein CbpA